MNSSKFEFFGSFAIWLHSFKKVLVSFAFLLMFFIASGADATVTVTLQLESEENALIDSHKVYVRQENQNYDFTKPAWQGSDTMCTLSGLEENVTYFFVARTYDKDGNASDNSNEIRFRQDSSDTPIDVTPPSEGGGEAENPNGEESDFSGSDDSDAANIDPKLGPVLIADTLNPNAIAADQLIATQWRIYREKDNLCVFDTTLSPASNEIQVPRLVLNEDTAYYYVARYLGADGQASEWTAKQNFIDTNLMPEDTNDDGIPDEKEVDAQLDMDENGTIDLQQNDIRCIKTATTQEQPIGLSVKGTRNVVSIEAVESISTKELPIQEDIEAAPEMPLGLINFRMLVTRPGEQAHVKVHLPSSSLIEQGYWWYLYDNINGWKDHSENVEMANEAEGVVVLKVNDGGDGDADGVENGIIVSQSGIASTPATGIGGGSSSGTPACFIGSVLD